MELLQDPDFWLSTLQIIWINILLSGDNALVIALACRQLAARQRMWGMVAGAGAAVGLRILFTGVVAHLMRFPFLKLAGGAALLWIAVKLVVPAEGGDDEVAGAESLWRAIKVVVVADIVMSLDNVIAIAAAVKGDDILMIVGLALSVPLIVAGASLVMMMLEKLPLLLWAGAGLLGWIAGEIMDEDPGLAELFGEAALPHKLWTAAAGATLVLIVAYIMARRNGRAAEAPVGNSG